MNIDISITVDDKLETELIERLQRLACSLRGQGIEVKASLQGAELDFHCEEDEEIDADDISDIINHLKQLPEALLPYYTFGLVGMISVDTVARLLHGLALEVR